MHLMFRNVLSLPSFPLIFPPFNLYLQKNPNMARNRKPLPLFEEVEIIDAGSEGKAVARVDDMVVFVPFVVPGDIVDIKVTRKKKSYYEGKAVKIHKYSEKRVEAFCEHFGVCGGCKWQNLGYKTQLFYKQKQVEDNLSRIGKIDISGILPIIPSENITFYRNKLEYTFSNRRWLVDNVNSEVSDSNYMNALGFHIPGMFDRILDINRCYLQEDPSNAIRLVIRDYALDKKLTFYNAKKWEGFLRNLIIRNTTKGDLMVIVIFNYKDKPEIEALLDHVAAKFSGITSLMYVINSKKNDTISDLEICLYKGLPYIFEIMPSFIRNKEGLKFKIGPVSFYQTNSSQAYQLYKVAYEFAGFKGDEIVYDLYTGTGTIANFVASAVKKVVGIEYIPSAIEDAIENSKINKINNTVFYSGDMVKVFDDDFINQNGKPEVLITDPPRAGMHDKVVRQIIRIAPKKVVYISCNPATQARDIALMKDHYIVEKIQPIDMFPHTHHVENVVLLTKIG